jgi:hypothetical protein
VEANGLFASLLAGAELAKQRESARLHLVGATGRLAIAGV